MKFSELGEPRQVSHVDVWTCKTNVEWSIFVPRLKGKRKLAGGYTVSWRRLHGARQPSLVPSQFGWTCECEGYLHTATCKHIEAVSIVDPRCRWNSEFEVVSKAYTKACDKHGRCPFCHGDAVNVPREFVN